MGPILIVCTQRALHDIVTSSVNMLSLLQAHKMVFGTELGDDVSLTLWKFLAAGFVIITGAHCTRRISCPGPGDVLEVDMPG
jgi:hypothetical protein